MSTSRMTSYHPMGRAGSQCYTKSQPKTMEATRALAPYLTKAIESIPFRYRLGHPFTLCDYGTSDGGMAVPLIQACVNQIHRLHGASTEIQLIYEDLPTNDFQSVFSLPQGSNVYASAVGKSFYEQCCPRETVHLGFSSIAVHWLSRRPCMIPDSNHAYLTRDIISKLKFAEQAKQDWVSFLRQREKEMVPGGQMVFCNMIVDDSGIFSVEDTEIVTDKSWRHLMADQVITKQEYLDATFPLYIRSRKEFLEPFTEDAPSHPRTLRLVATDIERFPCYQNHWESALASGTDYKKRFAASVTNSIQQWSHFVYKGALSPSRSPENRQQILDCYLEGVKTLIEEDLETFINMDVTALTMVIQKH